MDTKRKESTSDKKSKMNKSSSHLPLPSEAKKNQSLRSRLKLLESELTSKDSRLSQTQSDLTNALKRNHVLENLVVSLRKPLSGSSSMTQLNDIEPSLYDSDEEEKAKNERDRQFEKTAAETELFRALEHISKLELQVECLQKECIDQHFVHDPTRSNMGESVSNEVYLAIVRKCASLEQLLQSTVQECANKDEIIREKDTLIQERDSLTDVKEMEHLKRDNAMLEMRLSKALELGAKRDDMLVNLENTRQSLETLIVNEIKPLRVLPVGDMHRLVKEHWVADSSSKACEFSNCATKFGLLYRRHHCRACGHLFCSKHLESMALSLGTHSYDPSGFVTKVCTECYSTAMVF